MELERRTTAPAHATGAVEFVPLDALADDATFRLRDEGDVAPLAASIGRLGQLVPIELRPLPGVRGEGDGGPRFQVVAGFRRLAALRLLARERVLARVHATLDDDDAWGLALTLAVLTEPLLANELAAARERLAAAGIAPWADELLEDALARAPIDPRLRDRFHAWLARSGAAEEAEEPDAGAVDGAGAESAVGARAEAGDGLEDGAGVEDWGGIELAPRSGAAAAAADAPVEMTPDELAGDLAQRMYEVNQDLAVAFEAWAELPAEGRRAIVDQARYVAELLGLLDVDEEGR